MTTKTDIPIARGELWQRLVQTSAAALADGALCPVETKLQIIDDGGIPFSVRKARNLQRKKQEKAAAPDFDPFLPPEPALTVGAIGEEHIAVLNKFSVVQNHLLMVTRQFEQQEALLSPADFEVLCWCLREYNGLGFYNGGTVAGASQPHKHLQLVPALVSEGRHAFPVEAALPPMLDSSPVHLAALPYPHRIAGLPPGLFEEPQQAAAHCLRLYREMLADFGQTPHERDGVEYQSYPYNLLLTRRWLMLVPRTREHFNDISINAMGFAGSLFVMDEKGLEEIRRAGPVAVLQAVST